MPRATKSPHVAVLDYFRTAPIAVALLVLDLVKDVVKARGRDDGIAPTLAKAQTAVQAATASIGPAPVHAAVHPIGKKRGPKPKAKVAKPAAAAAVSPAKPKGKPGPKPGSHRRKPAAVAAAHPTANDAPLDLREPIGEVEQDLGFEMPQAEPGFEPPADPYTEPAGDLEPDGELQHQG